MKELKEQSIDGSKCSKTFSALTKSTPNKNKHRGKATAPSKIKLDKKFFQKNALVKPNQTPVNHSKAKLDSDIRGDSVLSSATAIMDKQQVKNQFKQYAEKVK